MTKGILFAVSAAALFGFIYYIPVLLEPLSVVEIFCWRLLISCPAVAILISFEKQWHRVFNLLSRIKKQPWLCCSFLFTSSMLALQMLLFIWGPLNGKALSISLGYFILPLNMVIAGHFFFKEKFSLYQKVAIFFAVLGVSYQLVSTGAFSWETLAVSVGYPCYLIFRRKMGIDGIEGTLIDFFLIAMGCFIFMLIAYTPSKIISDFLYHPVLIPLLGTLTAVSFAIYFAAAKLLPLGLFGLLSYLEPVLLTIISIIFLHENLSSHHLFVYLMIWIAVCVLVIEGAIYSLKDIKKRKFIGRH